MKAELGIVQETMLIPLVIKASETMRPNPRIHDRKAVEILGELEVDWTAQVEKGKKVIFTAEGLLMYFNREQVQELLGIISRSFPDYVMLAELMSPVAAKMSRHHDTVKHTGASFAWGTKSGKELEKICPGLRLIRENSFNEVMKGFTFRGWLFGTLPKIKHCNDRLAVFQYGC